MQTVADGEAIVLPLASKWNADVADDETIALPHTVSSGGDGAGCRSPRAGGERT